MSGGKLHVLEAELADVELGEVAVRVRVRGVVPVSNRLVRFG